MKAGGKWTDQLEEDKQVFFYVVNGQVLVNGVKAEKHHLVQLDIEGNEMEVKADSDSTILYCHGTSFNEPIVSQGPFVMNTRGEIQQAFVDYQQGKFGGL